MKLKAAELQVDTDKLQVCAGKITEHKIPAD
jgi:hypothetical protein